MGNIEILQKIVDYIEENIKSDLSHEEIAEIAGYSTYHFLHVFKDTVGVPLSTYITRRRVKHAIYEISRGKKLVDAALLFGFNTHAGFFKAFKREYGCSPSQYIKTSKAIKPVPVNLEQEAKIMLTQNQLVQILSKWEVDAKQNIGKVYYYLGNTKAYNIGEKYVLTTGTNIAGLRTHIEVAELISKKGIGISYPVKTKDGKDFFQDGERFYALLNRVEGEYLTPDERYAGDRSIVGEKYGQAIGKLHIVLKELEDELEVNDCDLYNTVVHWAMPETKRIMEQWNCPLPDLFFEVYVEKFGALHDKLPKQIIHRNPNPTNILFKNGEVTGLIDFDLSERNVRIFDPCYCATGILSESGKVFEGYDKWPELLRGIINGYDRICPLSEMEKAAIPYVIFSIQMIFIAWLDGRDEEKEIAMENRKMLEWIWKNEDKLTN